jgi:simple sugar transport system permease protein
MAVACIVSGALWAIIPAFFKAKFNTNETLFTLMLNYVAMQIIKIFIAIWVPTGSGVLSRIDNAHLPILFGQKQLLNILVVAILTVIMYIYMRYSKQGYEISVVGESENTAKYIGINVRKVIIRTMLISGAICGFAGFLIVGALDHSVAVTSVGGMGFTAIMVSWLAKFNPLIMIGTSAFITFLDQGAAQITTTFNTDSSFPDMVVGIVLFFIIGCEFFIGYQLKLKSREDKNNASALAAQAESKGGIK